MTWLSLEAVIKALYPFRIFQASYNDLVGQFAPMDCDLWIATVLDKITVLIEGNALHQVFLDA